MTAILPAETSLQDCPPGSLIRDGHGPNQYLLRCPRCEKYCVLYTVPHEWSGGHVMVSEDPVTIKGSIICPGGCGAHYHVTNGAIQDA